MGYFIANRIGISLYSQKIFSELLLDYYVHDEWCLYYAFVQELMVTCKDIQNMFMAPNSSNRLVWYNSIRGVVTYRLAFIVFTIRDGS